MTEKISDHLAVVKGILAPKASKKVSVGYHEKRNAFEEKLKQKTWNITATAKKAASTISASVHTQHLQTSTALYTTG